MFFSHTGRISKYIYPINVYPSFEWLCAGNDQKRLLKFQKTNKNNRDLMYHYFGQIFSVDHLGSTILIFCHLMLLMCIQKV